MHNIIYIAYFLHCCITASDMHASIYSIYSFNAYDMFFSKTNHHSQLSCLHRLKIFGGRIYWGLNLVFCLKLPFKNVLTVCTVCTVTISACICVFIIFYSPDPYIFVFTFYPDPSLNKYTKYDCDVRYMHLPTHHSLYNPLSFFLFDTGNPIPVRYTKEIQNLQLRFTVLQHDSDTVTSFTSSLHYTFNFYLRVLVVLGLRADIELHNEKFKTRGNTSSSFGERKK